MTLETAYRLLYIGTLLVLAALIGIMLVRSIIGPRVTDRILAINMIGTMVIASIAVLSQYLMEGYLLDVGLIYAMISFVSVLILASVYIPAHPMRGPFGKEAFRENEMRTEPKTGKKGKARRKRR
ncbi:MAG: sodium:proton antiporter [Lachnospiraceae bacterium]|nr:sodium:proton antiporter [Lachnospiraceae bacterium]